MKKYYELYDCQGNWMPAEFISGDEKNHSFRMISDNKEIKLLKETYKKREIFISNEHIKRLGFFSDESYIEQKGIKLIPVYNFVNSETSPVPEYFGYTILKSSEHEKNIIRFKNVFTNFNTGKIDKADVENEFESFKTISVLFQKLKEISFEFDEKQILIGNN